MFVLLVGEFLFVWLWCWLLFGDCWLVIVVGLDLVCVDWLGFWWFLCVCCWLVVVS